MCPIKLQKNVHMDQLDNIEVKTKILFEDLDNNPQQFGTNNFVKNNILVQGMNQELSLRIDDSLIDDHIFKRNNQINQSYKLEKIVGNGCFGVVYSAYEVISGKKVAIKKFVYDTGLNENELSIWSRLEHPNVLQLYHAFTINHPSYNKVQHAVTDYMPESLFTLLKSQQERGKTVPIEYIKIFAYQLFRGLAQMHAKGLVHRDIKPQNILFDPETLDVKLSDFGSADYNINCCKDIAQISTRQQRAPEILLGSENLSNAIDTWSVGVVIAEMILGDPFFAAQDNSGVISKIYEVLGHPNKDQLHAMLPHLQGQDLEQSVSLEKKEWRDVFTMSRDDVNDELVDLISRLLVQEPEKRLSPMKALMHPFFDDLFREDSQLKYGMDGKDKMPNLFEFSKFENEMYQLTIDSINQKLVENLKRI